MAKATSEKQTARALAISNESELTLRSLRDSVVLGFYLQVRLVERFWPEAESAS